MEHVKGDFCCGRCKAARKAPAVQKPCPSVAARSPPG